MTPLTESAVRERLHAVLDGVAPSQPPLAEVQRAVAARRRQHRVLSGIAALALIGAGVGVGLSVVDGSPGNGAGIHPVTPVNDPTSTFHDYVTAHEGRSPAGPLVATSGATYGAYVAGGRVQVLSFDGSSWSAVADFGSPLPDLAVVAVHPGPRDAAHGASFQVDAAGSGAAVNGVLVGGGSAWQYADFDCGDTSVACVGQGNRVTKWQVNGSVVNGVFHTASNDCAPSCVGRTLHDITWRWNPTYRDFVVAAVDRAG